MANSVENMQDRPQKGAQKNVSEGENLTIREWARVVNVKVSYAYEASRHNRIPGMFRVGKFVRINLPAYYKAKGLVA